MEYQYSGWPVRWWLLGLMLATSLPLLALAVSGIVAQINYARNEALDSAFRASSSTAATLREQSRELQRTAVDLARRAQRERPGERFCDRLHLAAAARPDDGLLVLDSDSTIICASGAPERAARIYGRLVVEQIRDGNAPEGRSMLSVDEGEPLLLVMRPLPAGQLLVLLRVVSIDHVLLYRGGVLTIIDQRATVLFRSPDPDAWVGRTVRGTEVTELILASGTGRTEARGLDGVSRQYGYTEMTDLDAYVYAGIATAEVMRPVRHLIVQWTVGGVILLAFLTAIAVSLSRRIVGPIAALADAARARGAGISLSVTPAGPRELAELAIAFNDMSERQIEAESRLTASERQYRSIVETAYEGIWVTDEHDRTVFVNRRVEEILGFPTQELLGRRPQELTSGRTKALLDGWFAELRGRRSGSNDLRFTRGDGRTIWLLIGAAPLFTDDGRYAGALGMITDITGRKEAELALRRSERMMKSLSDRLLQVQEEERTRIARELHDDLGQLLTALKMDIEGLIHSSPAAELNEKLVQRIETTLETTLDSVQRISSELRPGALDDLGLAAAVKSEARLFEERTGIECELSLEEIQIDTATETALFRIIHEALTNIARHANASRVEIRLRDRNHEALLEIRDDGRGVTQKELSDASSLGLTGIRERAVLVGGEARITGIAGRGTIVSVRVPSRGEQP